MKRKRVNLQEPVKRIEKTEEFIDLQDLFKTLLYVLKKNSSAKFRVSQLLKAMSTEIR